MRFPLFLTIVACLPSLSMAAPITSNTALPVSNNEFVIREQFIISSESKQDLELTQSRLVSTLAYGVTPKLTTFFVVPISRRTLDGSNTEISNSGLGDARLFGRYNVFQSDSVGKTFRIAPFAGIKAPTGDDNAQNSTGLLPRPSQLGSGSWDVFAGLISTYATVDWTFDTQLSYQANNDSNGFQFGDIARFDASIQYRLLPHKLNFETLHFINGVLELNIIDQDNNNLNGLDVNNTGGTTVLLAPGLQFITQRWITEASVQIPISSNPNDNAFETDYIARLGIRVNF